jgi:hypothetical protein
MDPFAVFTKMTGVMNMNLIPSALILLQPSNRSGALTLISKTCVPCHLGKSCKRTFQCKINRTIKISAKAGIQSDLDILDTRPRGRDACNGGLDIPRLTAPWLIGPASLSL